MRALALVVPLLFLVPHVGASHCTTWSTSVSDDSQIVIDTGTNEAIVHYAAIDRNPPEGDLFSIWLYREYNGIPGLQRGDDVRDDTCHGMIQSDGFEF